MVTITPLTSLLNSLWQGFKRNLNRNLIILGVLFLALNFFGDDTDTSVNQGVSAPSLRAAELVTARDLADSSTISILGNVRPASSAVLAPERSGRITRVNTSLGASVSAGQLLVELENAAERAAVLQAEGAYQAALAQSRQGDIGLVEAETGLRSALASANAAKQSALTTLTDVTRNTIDRVFSDPRSPVPGLKLDARGETNLLNGERVHFETQLNTLSGKLLNPSEPTAALQELKLVKKEIDRLLNLVDRLIPLLSDSRSTSGLTPADIISLQTAFTQARGQIVATQSALNGSVSALEGAVSNLERALVVATPMSGISQSDGQVRQALGALRAAEANLNKTLLRSPISGTVNSLDAKLGDFVSAQAPLANIANNNRFEIVAYISDRERDLIQVGSQVLAGTATSTITAIAPAINEATRKIEVRIESNDTSLRSGDTVRINLLPNSPNASLAAEEGVILQIPLTAVKLNGSEASILVPDGDKLKAQTVTLGQIRSGSVEILTGLGVDDVFVKDARRFTAGDSFVAK